MVFATEFGIAAQSGDSIASVVGRPIVAIVVGHILVAKRATAAFDTAA